MAGLGIAAIGILAFLVAPMAFWLRLRALRARPNSLVGQASRLAFHRFVVVGVVLLAQLALLAVLCTQPKGDEPPQPNHEYGPAFEAWRQNMMGAAVLVSLVSAAAWIAFFVIFVREIFLVIRTVRARSRILARGEPRTPPEGTTVALDFGVGDDYWAFYGKGRDGYREMRPIESWARGRPMRWPAFVGPMVSILTVLTMFVVIGMDLIFSVGD